MLWVAVPALVAALAALTWWLTGRALSPVERLTREAERIADPATPARLPVPPGDDEVAHLAATLNRMLDRLEASASRARRFVSDASHELRSPIATIRAMVESALLAPADVDWERLGRGVLAEDERLERLVADLLTLARHDEAPPADRRMVDLAAVVCAEAARERRVPVEVDAQPAVVAGSEERLGQVVRHLLDNAARHARARVAVSLRAASPVELVVTDDGAGIPPGDRERVFDRFARLDEARSRDAGGFGLGLAVVRAVVEEHGGAIAVDGHAAGGARFTVRLPAATGAAAAATPASSLAGCR